MEKFNIGDVAYFILIRDDRAYIAKGIVTAVFKVDDINTAYYITGSTFTRKVWDSELFKDPKDLIKNLCSCLIS